MSRHRRQPSRALPLDFNVDGDEEVPPAAAKGGATSSVDGSQQNPRAGGSGDGDAGGGAGKGQEGQTTKKKPPPATSGSRSQSDPDGTGANKPRHDDGTRGR
ncbi:hypothetical protein BDA96_03G461800 [Sorghum bicolor]|jgi:hypothetical protein|uniref:Uncharacterized protein n=2 Tax=Sorghum bicolor TaxID=4558 RepID=A0A921RLH5_SORBI|nr:uncharacterized protein LOC8077372 [Sorghum bicolor]KAG0541042.1 hypothetical protein BDA96_03G461800 [Sorghum bicolor]OQU88210.1 hypothetical protein SORBI_3003G429401 [Sorghum bicolor]|eukprot:XP_021311416.1 uncharacterized protein LOC8077372 [Sorghum bicolor]